MKLTLDAYSKKFKMSKEMINSRIKAKKINSIIENGVTYIIVANTLNEDIASKQTTKSTPTKRAIIELLLQQSYHFIKKKIYF